MAKFKGIIAHWTGGSYTPNEIDREHYHFLIDGDAVVSNGDHTPDDNHNVDDGDYAAHTRGCNTDFIGVSIAAMAGANENPFKPGKYPIKENQFKRLISFTAELCDKYNIPVTDKTVLSHAEVEKNLGIAQKQKWDIAKLTCYPHLMTAKAVGDYYRAEVLKLINPKEKK
jgi:N-acetyl-anhydromuramyl-L-alanine amidase AmpD